MKHRIAQVVVGLPLMGHFDYFIGDSLADKIVPGVRVWISFGKRRMVGYVIGLTDKSRFKKLKPVSSLIDAAPLLTPGMRTLAKKISQHYACSLGEAIEAILPKGLRNGKPVDAPPFFEVAPTVGLSRPSVLIYGQNQKKRWAFLVEKVHEALASGQSVIFLVPEVALLDAAYRKLKDKVSAEILFWGKSLNPSEELKRWQEIRISEKSIVLGTRSAIFAPVNKPGLIVVCDEENSAYKQEQSPFYHARDTALMRSRIDGCPVIFADTVPSVEIWYAAFKKKLNPVFFGDEKPVAAQTIDTGDYDRRKSGLLSFPLRSLLQKNLESGGKSILFLNRKGFSTMTRCRQCGYSLKCPRCDVTLTYLFAQKKMVCPRCQSLSTPLTVCPQCKSSYLLYKGTGIEKLESELSRMFPQGRVSRYEKDTPLPLSDWDILIATQALIKWQGLISAQLVGVLDLDVLLNRFDFQSAQKAFSLLVHLKSFAFEKLVVQTRNPDHYCVEAARKTDFDMFYRRELKLRRELKFPPFRHLIEVVVRASKEALAFEQASVLYQQLLKANKDKTTEILEVHPDAIAKLRGKFRFSILINSKNTEKTVRLIRQNLRLFHKKSAIVSVNVDP